MEVVIPAGNRSPVLYPRDVGVGGRWLTAAKLKREAGNIGVPGKVRISNTVIPRIIKLNITQIHNQYGIRLFIVVKV